MWKAKVAEALPAIVAAYPAHRWLLLTLTVPNVPLCELRGTLTHMSASWQRLTQRDDWPAKGCIRALEISRGANDYAHPHYHCLLMVNPSYFGGAHYISQARWLNLWRESTRQPEITQVDIRSIKGDPLVVLPEVLKYQTKPADLLRGQASQDTWLAEFHQQTHKIRSLSTSGVLKDFLKLIEAEDEDLLNPAQEAGSSSSEELHFQFARVKRTYNLHSACLM